MKKNPYHIIAIICLSICLLSCDKEKNLTPTNSSADFVYKLPQGNAAYDSKIVDIYNTYGTFILYRFTDADFRWTFTSSSLTPYTAESADTAYVDAALNYIFNNNLDLYGERLLKKLMPYKMLLASSLRGLIPNSKSPTLYDTAKVTSYPILSTTGYNHVTINNINKSFLQMTQGRKDSLRATLHFSLWKLALSKDLVEVPDEFKTVTDYSVNIPFTNPTPSGLLFVEAGVAPDAKYDLQYYMREISRNNEKEFAAKYLIPTVDVSGKILRKYNILKAYYLQKYGVDIRTIGNAH